MIRKLLFFSLVLIGSTATFGQNLQKTESELVKLFKTAEYYPYSPRNAVKKDETVEDSAFKARLLFVTSTIPGTLTYPFDSIKLLNPSLPSGGILNSDDSLVRIYCLRGHDYLQYKFGDGVKSLLLPTESGTFRFSRGYRNLYSFVYEKKTYYLAIYEITNGEGVKVFSITPEGLIDSLPRFKTPDGLKNKISYTAKNSIANPDGYIYFDGLNTTLYMPSINKNDSLTNKPEPYKFTGGYFEKEGK